MGRGGIIAASASARYAASDGYFSYMWGKEQSWIQIEYSGSGTEAVFRILLPKGFVPAKVTRNGADLKFSRESVADSAYIRFQPEDAQRGSIRIYPR